MSDLKQYKGQELTVIAWLWARTVKSPNPVFNNVDVPLSTSFVLSSKKGNEVYVEPIIEAAKKHNAYLLKNLFFIVPIIKYRIFGIENPEHLRNELCVSLNELNVDLNYSDQFPIIAERRLNEVKENPELMSVINENADQVRSLIHALRSIGSLSSESEITSWLITLSGLLEQLLD